MELRFYFGRPILFIFFLVVFADERCRLQARKQVDFVVYATMANTRCVTLYPLAYSFNSILKSDHHLVTLESIFCTKSEEISI